MTIPQRSERTDNRGSLMIGVTFSTPWVMAHKLCFEGPSTSELSSHTLCVFEVSPVSYQVKER